MANELEDLKQQAWVAVCEAVHRAGGIENTGGYLRRTIRYAVKDYIRAYRRDALSHRQ